MHEVTNQEARIALQKWQEALKKNVYTVDKDFIHSIQLYFTDLFSQLTEELTRFGDKVANDLENLVSENNLAKNLPSLKQYDALGNRIDQVIHHPSYIAAGEIIYQSHLLTKLAKPGHLLECLSFLFLSAQTGEAGHNCPIACSAGIIRVLQKVADFPNKKLYLDKLLTPSFTHNFTGAQFLTEIQGGSDVGLNATIAENKDDWLIYGEKWFCSNAGADLIFLTARFDKNQPGTKGLGLFLVPAVWNQKKNYYSIRRLKDKIGTRSMATGEIDFQGAHAIQIGNLEEGFHLVMDNVLHLSRLFNSFCVLGMARRAYFIAKYYAIHRVAFSHPIIQYPLVKENLARIKAENSSLLAGIIKTAHLQDQFDTQKKTDKQVKLLLRFLVNLQKYLSSLWSVEHIHLALGILAGNGAIETFSAIPRLLRDCIVCENWEGTHHVLRMQILRDIHKYQIDKIYFNFMQKEMAALENRKELALINAGLTKLQEEIIHLQQQNNELQTLLIQPIVDRMGILFCGLMLLKEALAQNKMGRTSKLENYQLFSLLHLNENKPEYNAEYLSLITKIVNDE